MTFKNWKIIKCTVTTCTTQSNYDVIKMLALPWSSWKEKHQSLFRRYCGQINPVDYTVWIMLQEKVYKTRITDLNHFKYPIRIRTEWAKLRHIVIAVAVRQWRCRLSACVRVGSDHFEHCF